MNILVRKSARSARILDVDIPEYLHDQLVALWQDAVEEFVLEVQKHIAIDTGMSAASLIPLAENVGLDTLLRASIAAKRKRYIVKGYNPPGGFPRPSTNKSMQAGESAGSSAYSLNFGTPLIPRVSFTFDIQVWQYYLHENLALPGGSGPWRSLQKGLVAFDTYIKTHFTSYFDPKTLVQLAMRGGLSG